MNPLESIGHIGEEIGDNDFSEENNAYDVLWRDISSAKDRVITVFQQVFKFSENTFWYLSFIRKLFEGTLTLLSRDFHFPSIVVRIFKTSKLISGGRKFFYIPLIISSSVDLFRLESLKERISALWKMTYAIKKVASSFLIYSRMLKEIEQIIPFIFAWRKPLQYSMLPLSCAFLLRRVWILYQVSEQAKEVMIIRKQLHQDNDEIKIKNTIIEFLTQGIEYLPKASKTEYEKIRYILESLVDDKATKKDMDVLLGFCESHLLTRQFLLLLTCIKKILLLCRSVIQMSESDPKMLLATVSLLECGLALLREFFKCYDRCASTHRST